LHNFYKEKADEYLATKEIKLLEIKEELANTSFAKYDEKGNERPKQETTLCTFRKI
jgi:hypothetical protein